MRRTGSRLALCASLVFAWATSGARSASARARLISPLDGPEVNSLGVEADGTRRTISHGLRALVHPDGSVEMAEVAFPLARGVQLVELPRRFGHGFLFSMSNSGRASLWFAKTFTDALVPFAALDFEIDRIVPGFDRLYVQARRSGEWVALDAENGAGVERGPLPLAPNYGALAFADAWFGAVELPIQGVVASFDAGGSWHPLGPKFKLVGEEDGEIVVAAADGRKKLAPDGTLRAVEGAPVEAGAKAVRRSAVEGPAGSNPLANAMLRGIADSETTALLLYRGALSRVRLSDGRVLDSRARVVAPSASCSALPLGEGAGFACQEPHGKTQIVAVRPGLALEVVETFDSPRRVLSSGNGALVIRGGCSSSISEATRVDVHCVRTRSGARFELKQEGTVRVVALRDGSAAVITPPEHDKLGTLARVLANGTRSARPLVLDDHDEGVRNLVTKGFWLDAWIENDKGELTGWVAGQSSFAGVRIGTDGHVHAGVLRRRVERALISGDRVLLIAAAGIAEQSVDGGRTYTDVDLPPELTLEAPKNPAQSGSLEQGCSALGCAFAGWARVGWDGPTGGKPLGVAPQPKATSFPQPGGGRWLLRCAPTGETSAPAIAVSAPSRDSENATAPWLPLWDLAAPQRARDSVAFDVGADAELRAYAWAPRGADFGKAGRFSVSALDVYRVQGGVWRTLPSSSPWSDPAQVAEIFGYEGSVPSSWRLNLDASGRAGVLSVSARGTTELFAVAENRGVVPLLNATRAGVGNVASAVEMESGFYVAAQEEPRSLRVFALEGGDARLLGQYADLPQSRGLPVLVRSTRRDALALWTRGAGWFVFPIDLRTGAVSSAIEISARALSRFPRSCEPDEDGYLLEGPVGIEPYAEFVDGAEKVVATGFSGRFIVSDRGICVASLAARADDPVDRKLSLRTKSRTASDAFRVPLVVSDRSEHGRRWGFRCAN